MRKIESQSSRFSIGKKVRISLYLCSIIFLLSVSLLPLSTYGESERPLVYTVVLDDTVEKGLHAFLERAVREAEDAGAAHILIDMDTYGGAVDAADKIGDLFKNTKTPQTVFVNPNAISAGAFIALNADNILITPTGRIGAASVVDMEGNIGDAKTMSMWIEAMGSAAESGGRDPLYAKAMVDPEIRIEGFSSPLTFSARDAFDYGYAEAIVNNLDEALAFLGLENAIIEEIEISVAENIARFLTNPIVASILLSLASLGLILELYSPGFGVPGIVGLSSLFLFFFGHMVAGFAGWESLILFIVGIGLLIFEILTPSFGIFGILGIAGVIISLLMASVDITAGLMSIGIAIVVTIVVILLLGKSIRMRRHWLKLVLQEDLSSEEGKLRSEERSNLIGQEGITLTKLRPSGAVLIKNQRYDVVSEGGMVDKDQLVMVTQTEGTRIVVRPISKD